jgi:hypothetical protein
MVAPKENALACRDCHAQDGRLDTVPGMYLPARDRNRWVDLAGMFLIFGTVGGTLTHAAFRGLSRKKGTTGGTH